MKIEFVVYGNPKAQKRHRTGKGYNYDPSASDKADFLALADKHRPDELITGGFELQVLFFFPRPKSHYDIKGKVKKRFKDERHTKKPDTDNLVKFVKDALNGKFWRDDAQCDELHAYKEYGGKPGTRVHITYAEGGER
ncbi:MAG: RusA family crossover junction endodeoxyribonuclease [FCB group bacterium]|nr:RusA family crossover junction endodeoxyribonuclease [FCB group bacterium]